MGRPPSSADDAAQAAAASAEPTSLLAQLPPPTPFRVRARNLSIQAPVPRWVVPLAIPFAVPRWIQRRLQKGEQAVPTELVRGVSLEIAAGEVLALIGGSGSGKTTFLNVLAGRVGNLELPTGEIEYTPLAAASPPSTPARKRFSTAAPSGNASLSTAKKAIGYVRQDDALLPYLTVRETLETAAALRLPKSVSSRQRAAIVEQTMAELGLRDVADVVVGGALRRGISGGERRRLSIGCTLVTLPSVLLLDEPTSGLDSSTAFQILQTLQRLAANGRVVVLSCHLPRSEAFSIFDKILLLSRGSPVFSGNRDRMLPHFASLGYPLPPHTNPLDFVIDISSVDSRTDKAEQASQGRVAKLVKAWQEQELVRGSTSAGLQKEKDVSSALTSTAADLEKADSTPSSRMPNGNPDEPPRTLQRANALQQTRILTRRGMRNVVRNWGVCVGFAVQAIVIGVVLGLVFLEPPETPAGIVSLKTLAYMNAPAFYYLSIILAIFLLCEELVVFDRDREDNLYSTVPWVVSVILSYGPINVLCATTYSVILYFMGGFWRQHLAKNVLSFIAHGILQQQAAWSYALLACSIQRSFAQASLLANGVSIMFFLSAGYLITDLPPWVEWTKWLSPFFYGFQWVARLQFVGRTFACEGVTGPALNQCEGINVLRGMRFNLGTPLYVFPLGLLGFVLVTYALAALLLATYHPGGVKHAAKQVSKVTVEPASAAELKRSSSRRAVDIVVSHLKLVVVKRGFGKLRARREKVILEDVSAHFPPSKVSAIMGPSGAGKSSLLQVLAGRLSSSAMSSFTSTGSITLNGQPFDSSLASLVAFVEQEDAHHLPALTVRETLRYAARLKLKKQSTAACHARAEEIIRMLGLAPCADNLVGGELLKGISGGEKRRVSLGVQLIAGAAVLYADEPLTGLDAFTAQSVMQTLSDLAAAGHTVVITVHQPRAEIWDAIDEVLLLAKGGRTVYSGPAREVLLFFEGAGEVCPSNYNPADFVLDAISLNYASPSAEEASRERVDRLVETWKSVSGSYDAGEAAPPAATRTARLQATPFLKAFPVVIMRSFTNLRRQPDIFVARIANPPFLACLFWLFFARLDYGPSSAQDRIGLLQETTALPFVGMLACLSIFPFERALFYHEYKSSARQSVTTFLAAYTVQETATSLLSSLPWAVIFVYGMNLQAGGRRFVEFWLSSFALISVGESIGICFSALTSNGGLAVSLVSAGLTLLGQVNGIVSATVPHWLQIIAWISPMKPQAAVATINEFAGLVFACTPAEVASGACIAATGEQVLDTFSLPHKGTGKYMGILMALVVLWRAAAWAALRARVAFL
ncbi:ATP-binding cassette transporter snq2 [Rhodotorula kratochvilovae]